MTTAVIQIGNTDDKLSQEQWRGFILDIELLLQRWRYPIHFAGFSRPDERWQNACWVLEVDGDDWLETLRSELRRLARAYSQDSIALTVGHTEFVEST